MIKEKKAAHLHLSSPFSTLKVISPWTYHLREVAVDDDDSVYHWNLSKKQNQPLEAAEGNGSNW